MTVTSIETYPVAYPEPNDFDATRHLCLVKVVAEGVSGWGEAVTMWPDASVAVANLVQGLAPLVIGRDPRANDSIWSDLKRHAWWYGYEGGLASFAIAALDIALWDLKGRLLGESVCALLGGPVHSRLPAIASSHAHHDSIDAMVGEGVEWLATGLHGMKVGFGKRGNARLGYEHDRDVSYVRKLRGAIGPQATLIVDVGVAVQWDLPSALRRVDAFADYGLDWIEEPLGPWDPIGYAKLREKTGVRMGYGEREWTTRGYKRALETGTCDVVGIDPGRAEGITGFMRAAQLAQEHGSQANAHAWSSAIVSAASLAASFASPACALFEVKPLPSPMQHELVTNPIEHASGWMYPPIQSHGLGIDVIEEVVERYRLA